MATAQETAGLMRVRVLRLVFNYRPSDSDSESHALVELSTTLTSYAKILSTVLTTPVPRRFRQHKLFPKFDHHVAQREDGADRQVAHRAKGKSRGEVDVLPD